MRFIEDVCDRWWNVVRWTSAAPLWEVLLSWGEEGRPVLWLLVAVGLLWMALGLVIWLPSLILLYPICSYWERHQTPPMDDDPFRFLDED